MKHSPVSTGWTLFSNIEKANRVERLETTSATFSSLVNHHEILFPKAKHKIQKTTPILIDVLRITLMENIAALAFPFPSSFDMRTLYKLFITRGLSLETKNDYVTIEREREGIDCLISHRLGVNIYS